MILLWLFLRGVLQVGLVSLQVQHLRHGRTLAVFATGVAISAVWWLNAASAAHEAGLAAPVAYTLGAGIGAVLGMRLGDERPPAR